MAPDQPAVWRHAVQQSLGPNNEGDDASDHHGPPRGQALAERDHRRGQHRRLMPPLLNHGHQLRQGLEAHEHQRGETSGDQDSGIRQRDEYFLPERSGTVMMLWKFISPTPNTKNGPLPISKQT